MRMHVLDALHEDAIHGPSKYVKLALDKEINDLYA